MIFYHEYTDLDLYRVKGSDFRIWNKTDELYLEFCKTQTPENISGNEFVIIVDGVVTIDTNKDVILAQRQADAAAVLADLAQKEADFNDTLPSWGIVATAFDNLITNTQAATTLAACKTVLVALINITRKMARVLYWLAKNRRT